MKTSFFLVGLGAFLALGCSDSRVRFGDAGSDAEAGCTIPSPARHRVSGEMCPMDRAAPPIVGMFQSWWECSAHADCTDGVNGRCIGDEFQGYRCTYDACFDDSACGGGPCSCRGSAGSGGENRCLEGNCQTDSDCGPGGFCSPTQGSCGDYAGTVGYYCHTCEDECTDDADCGGYPSHCDFDNVLGRWRCEEGQCAG